MIMPTGAKSIPLFLAPMSGVSDLPFRLLAKECGADFTITEFTSSAALTRDVAQSWLRLESDDREIPFIPQIFGGNIDEMVKTVELLQNRADIIDLNFGYTFLGSNRSIPAQNVVEFPPSSMLMIGEILFP